MFIPTKYNQKAASCMKGICLHVGTFGPAKLANKAFNRSKKKASPVDTQMPAKCPAFALFAVADQTLLPDSQELMDQLEQCIRDGQTAIGQLEQLRAHPNLLQEIQQAFEGDEGRKFLEKFVHQVKAQFELARQIEKIVPSLLEAICSGQFDIEESQSIERVFAKNFAKLLDMAIRFDCLKVGTPTLQNGFSLFRRMCLLKSFGDSQPLLYAHVGDQIALFLSRCTPLFTSIVNGAERFIGRQLSRELALSHLTEAMLVIYNVLRHTVQRRSQLSIPTAESNCPVTDFLFRAMVGILLLFDHVQVLPGGVFNCTQSPFDVVQFAALVRSNCSVEKAQEHLSALRFMARHFNDAETPGHVRKMFS